MNEFLFLITSSVDLLFLVLMYLVRGKHALVAAMIVNLVLVSTFGGKLITLFGFTTNVTNISYAVVFAGANILVEKYGKKAGLQAVLTGLFTLILFVLMSQFYIRFYPVDPSAQINDSLQYLFTQTPRLALASIIAYIVALSCNVWCYSLLMGKLHNKYLAMRVIVSSILGQGIDSILFFMIAFYGSVSNELLFQIGVTGFVIKVLVSILSIPFIYASHWITSSEGA